MSQPPNKANAKLFHPLKIANGRIQLSHRVIYAPMTRNRGIPIFPPPPPAREDMNGRAKTVGREGDKQEEEQDEKGDGGSDGIARSWYPDDLMAEYYSQRATEGGLLITEAIPTSEQGTGLPGAPGLFHPLQIAGWRKVTTAVHAKGGRIYAQLWHCGRVTLPHWTGKPSVSASAEPWGSDDVYPYPPPGAPSHELVRYKDCPPQKLDRAGIHRVIEEIAQAARNAMQAGFDGVEVHGANGYLPEQFLSSNINTRDDEYGGSAEKRPRFVLDLLAAISAAIGSSNVAIRLSPFGLCHQARSEQRLETWSALCRGIKQREDIGPLSYIHFIEPRWEQLHSLEDKARFLNSAGLADVSLAPFREIMGDTPLVSAGGRNPSNCWDVVENGEADAVAFGRLFLANPDFVQRLKMGWGMNAYDRSRFYGPTPERELGYTDYPTWEEMKNREGLLWSFEEPRYEGYLESY